MVLPLDDEGIEGRSSPARSIIPRVENCPKCGKQCLISVVGRLPKYYDDPTHPISMVPIRDAMRYSIDVFWSSEETKKE